MTAACSCFPVFSSTFMITVFQLISLFLFFLNRAIDGFFIFFLSFKTY